MLGWHEVIVVYQSTAGTQESGGRRRTLTSLNVRIDEMRERARKERPNQQKFFEAYHKMVGKALPRDKPVRRIDLGNGILPVASLGVTRQTIDDLCAIPGVLAVMPNQSLRLIDPAGGGDGGGPDQDEFDDQMTWGLTALKAPDLWKRVGKKGTRVAVLDTGVDAHHPALQGRVKEYAGINPQGEVVQSHMQQAFDVGHHGTHVCGTIAGSATDDGVAIGVAPETDLVIANVFVGGATLNSLINGMTWAARAGAQVLSLSLGFTKAAPEFEILVRGLLDNGSVIVAAIGNDGPGSASNPGCLPGVLGVGAVNRIRDVALFSGGKPAPPEPAKPDVVAPGVKVHSCAPTHHAGGRFITLDGSSMATPHVAGAISLLMHAVIERGKDLDAEAVVEAVKSTAWHPGNGRPDDRLGWGMIDPVAALDALVE